MNRFQKAALARAEALSPERRSEIARMGYLARGKVSRALLRKWGRKGARVSRELGSDQETAASE